MAENQELYHSILNSDAKKAHATTELALAAGVDPMQLTADYMVPAMHEVGRLLEAEGYRCESTDWRRAGDENASGAVTMMKSLLGKT